jgi:hypothetical protein
LAAPGPFRDRSSRPFDVGGRPWIVCANTLAAALRQAEHGVSAQRTFRFRHTGDLQAKFVEARKVLGMTIDYQKQFKELADRLAREAIGPDRFERTVLRHLWRLTRTPASLRAPTGNGQSPRSSISSPDVARRQHDRQQRWLEVGRMERDRRAPRLRPPLHLAD